MTICRLMIEAFEGKEVPEKAYDLHNLKEGIAFAEWLLEEGQEETPTPPVWNCRKFIRWAQKEVIRFEND